MKTRLGKVLFTIFQNKETKVRIKENIRNKTVFIIQSISDPPTSSLFELLLLANASKNGGAKKIIGVIPWLGYSAQDKIFQSGESLSSQLVAQIIKAAGINRVILLDVHSPLNITYLKKIGVKVSSLSAKNIFINKLKKYKNSKNWLIVSLDRGAKQRSLSFSRKLNLPLICFDKKRNLTTGKITFKKSSATFKEKNVISFDDFIATGKSSALLATTVKKLKARKYIMCATHGILTSGSSLRIKKSKIDKLFLTDSYPIPPEKRGGKIKILTCTEIIVREIKRLLSS